VKRALLALLLFAAAGQCWAAQGPEFPREIN